MPKTAGRAINGPLLLSISEVAQTPAVSRETVRKRVLDGTIRAVRIGSVTRLPASAVEEILLSLERPAREGDLPAGAERRLGPRRPGEEDR
jgi:excisionase family DNA binding protein